MLAMSKHSGGYDERSAANRKLLEFKIFFKDLVKTFLFFFLFKFYFWKTYFTEMLTFN